ncbi:MAG: hypothetical protein CVU90_11340 [Firmicutes bacterium HGW-Firmicutes-15]|nr:MAG: hypothetical protein CVU90_11340 [Firmicutes bacterium HGW-Firmicutes-15]
MDGMKYFKTIFGLAIFLAILGLGSASGAVTAERKPINHVFLISVGGLNREGFVSNSAPNMKYLMMEGAASDKTLAIRSDTMEAAETSLLTGALADAHKHLTANDKVEVESIFDVLKRNGRSILVVDGTGGKLSSFAYGEKEYKQLEARSSSQQIMDEAYKSFSQNKPFFSYFYIDDCTDALLRQDQDAYYHAIRNFDTQLGIFVKRLKDSGLYDKSLIIVTSARSTSPSNLVPLIIYGPGCNVNSGMSGAMTIDVASTICRLIGLEAPASSRGIPIYGSLQLSEEERQNLASTWIKDLQKDRQANWNMNFRLEDELSRTIRQMSSIKEEKQSVFDFAGEREQLIIGLKSKITVERAAWCGFVVVMLAGYVLEYVLLKKKFLLFK